MDTAVAVCAALPTVLGCGLVAGILFVVVREAWPALRRWLEK
jgi:hypothetical protein